MFKHLLSSVCGAAVVLAGAAAMAAPADDVEGKVAVCSVCHGANGVPIDPKTMPIIWGQQTYYIVKQLHDYRSGERETPVMGGIAKGLQAADIRKIANYFAAKPWPARQGATADMPAPPKI